MSVAGNKKKYNKEKNLRTRHYYKPTNVACYKMSAFMKRLTSTWDRSAGDVDTFVVNK